jgi:D-arabinose 1-dehydrogenase-like Zn-dependent alcohol dehydrogenase
MLDVHGHFAAVGLLDESLPGFNAMSLLGHGAVFRGSRSAGKKECLQIIQLVVDKSVKP